MTTTLSLHRVPPPAKSSARSSLIPLGLKPYTLAKKLRIPPHPYRAPLVAQRTPVTPDTALRLAKNSSTPPRSSG